MGFFSNLFVNKRKQAMLEAIDKGAKVVDVRTPGEFKMGNVNGSINIPINKMNDSSVKKLKRLNTPVIVCCASGSRSASATHYLKSNGIEAYNGGSWFRVNRLMAV